MDRLKRKMKVMSVIQTQEYPDPKKIHEKIYIDDSELGTILTEMLRHGEVEYAKRPRGKVGLRLTAAGVEALRKVEEKERTV